MNLPIFKARNIFLGFCLLLIFLFSVNPVSARDKSNDFIISPADNVFADSALFYLEYFRDRLSAILYFELDTVVTLYIANSDDEFKKLVGSEFPDWGAGAASVENARIIIKSPKYIRTGKTFRELIGHELSHVMLYRAAGRQWLPRWIHEGVSMKVAGEWDIGQDILVARAAWTNNLISLMKLEGLSEFNGAQASLAYTESYLAASKLIKPADPYLIADILSLYRETRDFRKSFKVMVGIDYLTWTTNWMEKTSMHYHFFLFLFDRNLLWIMLPVLFIFLILYKRRQNRKVKKRWKREERRNPSDNSYNEYYDGYYDDKDQI